MSEKLYTDEELCWATQVAYCNVNMFDIKEYKRLHGGNSPTLQEIFSDLGYSVYYDQKLITGENAGDKLLMQETAKQFIDDVIAGKICQGWKVVSVSDERQEDIGFYGLTIETGDNNAIVAFRGSESVDPNQFIEDWIVADFGIINGKMTEQGLAAAEYVKSVGENFDYDNFALTGHSLGGNLALAATIYSATEDFGGDMCERIKQAVSFDGPGHPDEFFAKYQKEIDQMAGVMTHNQWSWVGAIFTSVCEANGTYNRYVSDKMESLVYKHSTASLEFKDGTLEKAEHFDPLANAVHYITINVDDEAKVQYFMASLINCVIEGSQRFYDLSEKYDGVFSTEPYLNYVGKTTNLLIALSLYNTIYNGKPAGSLGISENENRLQEAVRKSLVGYLSAVNEFSHDMRKKAVFGIEAYKTIVDMDSYITELMKSSVIFGMWARDRLIQNVVSESVTKYLPVYGALREMDAAYLSAGTAVRYVADPLVFDLDGDGFETLETEDGVYFDENNTGLKEKTEWVAADDGLLALDVNNDGVIDSKLLVWQKTWRESQKITA